MNEDKRYFQAAKETLVGLCIFALNFLWWFGLGYGLGSQPPENYTYVMGFPAWFFWSCVVGPIVFSALTWVAVKLFFSDIPLDGKGGEQG
ncbi:MAG: YhdT family protein [Bacillota bacterium]